MLRLAALITAGAAVLALIAAPAADGRALRRGDLQFVLPDRAT